MKDFLILGKTIIIDDHYRVLINKDIIINKGNQKKLLQAIKKGETYGVIFSKTQLFGWRLKYGLIKNSYDEKEMQLYLEKYVNVTKNKNVYLKKEIFPIIDKVPVKSIYYNFENEKLEITHNSFAFNWINPFVADEHWGINKTIHRNIPIELLELFGWQQINGYDLFVTQMHFTCDKSYNSEINNIIEIQGYYNYKQNKTCICFAYNLIETKNSYILKLFRTLTKLNNL